MGETMSPMPETVRRDPLAKIIDADRVGYAEEQRQARAWMGALRLSALPKQEPRK